ncbi:hypothetical protein FALBO_16146 [Fusarium albosuccineum]|uniref:Uncharacterized protein n=1 Tax=Fusarium albosuccineum TaxID=1237068 RepID=A0A8H4KML7_9HYPO|nr:hypothetical protein FALBO_16146 [Fusarium albosuccineum]
MSRKGGHQQTQCWKKTAVGLLSLSEFAGVVLNPVLSPSVTHELEQGHFNADGNDPLIQELLGAPAIVDTTGARIKLGKAFAFGSTMKCAVHYPPFQEATRAASFNMEPDDLVLE